MKNFKFIVNRNGGCGAHTGKEANTPPCCSKRASRFVWVLVLMLTLGVGQMWGALSSPYECTFTAGMSMSGSNCTTGDVTWTITTTTGKGSPTPTFGNQNGQSCIKLGSGQNHYYSKITLTTSAFTSYNVTSVVIYASSNNGGSKTFKVMQGETQIGTGSQSFSSTTWVSNITRNTTAGSGGDLSIEISNDKTATFIHSIKVTYSAPSCTVTPTVGSSLSSVEADVNSITATVPISAIGGCNITENGLVYSTTAATPTVGGTGCTKVFTTACGATAANKTVTINELACGTTYYVRGYATNAAGTSYTNVTTQSTSACPTYTVTLKDDNSTLPQVSYGAEVELPTREGCTGYTFAGWTKSWNSAQTEWTTSAPEIIEAGSYTPTDNENLYPVYTKTVSNGTSDITIVPGTYTNKGSSNYGNGAERTGTVSTIAFGGHYITGNAANNTNCGSAAAGTYLQCKANDANIYNKTAMPGNITRVVVNQYAAQDISLYCGTSQLMESSNTSAGQTPSGTAQTAQTAATQMPWNVSGNNKFFALKKGSGTSYISSIVITYANSTTSYISVPNCCTELGQINGSFFWTTHFCPVWPAKHRS